MHSPSPFCKFLLPLTQIWKAGVMVLVAIICFGNLANAQVATAQQKNQMIRFAKIKVDPSQLKQYTTALNEQMAAAIRLEPGVLSYYAVADKSDPSNITILEIYADSTAYKSHIQTAHFKKYKDTVKDMVKFLELVDLDLINSAKKPGM